MSRIIRQFETLAESWIAEEKRRRQVTEVDAVADTLRYAAAELLERVRLASCDTEELTAEEFAQRHRVTPATVRRWARRGRLGARLTPAGYVIPADAIPPLKRAG